MLRSPKPKSAAEKKQVGRPAPNQEKRNAKSKEPSHAKVGKNVLLNNI